ncbi:MAG: branched-chain amino acid ABC transporter permease [Deltaproteobacteria bacterium]|nr:branched-chain amino acid ABC transporter permease [Deltaproteobacteria bacterium]
MARDLRRAAFHGALLAAAAAYPFLFTRPFPQDLAIKVFLFGGLASAWNVLGGYTGQVSLGNAIFFGIGAYGAAVVQTQWGWTPWAGMAAGAAAAVLVGLFIGYPCFRLKGHYFAMATLAIGEVVAILVTNWSWVGGAIGLYIPIREDTWAYFQFGRTKLPYYYVMLAYLVLAVSVPALLLRRRIGYCFRAIKEDQDAARALGVDARNYKLAAMGISAAITSAGGSLYAQYVLFIDPHSVFPMMLSIQVVLTAILGGVGTVWGPVVGALILIPLSEFTRIYIGGTGSGLDLIAYGLLIIAISVLQPRGVLGFFRRTP